MGAYDLRQEGCGIGAAEGYYLTGMALKGKVGSVVGVDIDERALAFCRRMALLNGQTRKIELLSECDQVKLEGMVEGRRAFVLSDCEGYEQMLFANADPLKYSDTDLLIEVHEGRSPGVCRSISENFSTTHNVQRITHQPRKTSDSVHVGRLPRWVRKFAVAEFKDTTDHWLFLCPKSRHLMMHPRHVSAG